MKGDKGFVMLCFQNAGSDFPWTQAWSSSKLRLLLEFD